VFARAVSLNCIFIILEGDFFFCFYKKDIYDYAFYSSKKIKSIFFLTTINMFHSLTLGLVPGRHWVIPVFSLGIEFAWKNNY